MSSNGPLYIDSCTTDTATPTLPRKRTSSYASVSKMSSIKRKRLSILSGDIDVKLDFPGGLSLRHSNSVDRFVPSRPKGAIPLNVTPRTNRISRQFGLSSNRIFSFKENVVGSNADSKVYGMLRRSASSLFSNQKLPCPSSVTQTLTKRQQCDMVLDGPGVTKDPHASPITWSRKDLLAIACDNNIYYQNLTSRAVHRLCKVDLPSLAETRTIEWGGLGHEYTLALGTSTGVVQVWDAGHGSGSGTRLRMWREAELTGIAGMDWNGDSLAVGSHDGTISLFDTRSKTEARRVPAHKGKVIGLKWSTCSTFLASSDNLGMVYIWDQRTGKRILENGARGSKMRHRGPVKALAWCPWKPDLLATGSTYPEGKIRIWSSLSTLAVPEPIETITLHTSVLSLHWSPHCKELLSTHGSSFQSSPTPRRSSAPGPPLGMKVVSTPLSNAIAVHEYPSAKRLLTLTAAHLGPVTHSCLGPSGEDLFSICPKDETIRKWHVWNKRTDNGKEESAFDKWSIR